MYVERKGANKEKTATNLSWWVTALFQSRIKSTQQRSTWPDHDISPPEHRLGIQNCSTSYGLYKMTFKKGESEKKKKERKRPLSLSP